MGSAPLGLYRTGCRPFPGHRRLPCWHSSTNMPCSRECILKIARSAHGSHNIATGTFQVLGGSPSSWMSNIDRERHSPGTRQRPGQKGEPRIQDCSHLRIPVRTVRIILARRIPIAGAGTVLRIGSEGVGAGFLQVVAAPGLRPPWWRRNLQAMVCSRKDNSPYPACSHRLMRHRM